MLLTAALLIPYASCCYWLLPEMDLDTRKVGCWTCGLACAVLVPDYLDERAGYKSKPATLSVLILISCALLTLSYSSLHFVLLPHRSSNGRCASARHWRHTESRKSYVRTRYTKLARHLTMVSARRCHRSHSTACRRASRASTRPAAARCPPRCAPASWARPPLPASEPAASPCRCPPSLQANSGSSERSVHGVSRLAAVCAVCAASVWRVRGVVCRCVCVPGAHGNTVRLSCSTCMRMVR